MSEEKRLPEHPSSRRLPIAILWGLSPALLMGVAALLMKLPFAEDFGGMLMAAGLMGGPIALLGWSVWLVLGTRWSGLAKGLSVLPIALLACTVNLFLAAGACAAIQPPMGFH